MGVPVLNSNGKFAVDQDTQTDPESLQDSLLTHDVAEAKRPNSESLKEPLLTHDVGEVKGPGFSTESDYSESEAWDEIIAFIRKMFGETLASFFVVFTLLAMKVNTDGWGSLATIANSIIGGLIVMVTIFSLGHVSGSHINPVVTIAYTITRNFPIWLAPLYMLAQFLGGLLAAFVVDAVYQPSKDLVLVTPESSVWQSFLAELLAGFLLMVVASAVSTDTRAIGQFAGIAVGSIIAIDILVVGPVSGGGINPARVLGPAFVYLDFSYVWIYCVAPVIGGVVGATVYKLLRPAQVWKRGNYSLSSRSNETWFSSLLSRF